MRLIPRYTEYPRRYALRLPPPFARSRALTILMTPAIKEGQPGTLLVVDCMNPRPMANERLLCRFWFVQPCTPDSQQREDHHQAIRYCLGCNAEAIRQRLPTRKGD